MNKESTTSEEEEKLLKIAPYLNPNEGEPHLI